MCIIAVALDSHPYYPFIAIANRDEYRDRPTSAAHRWPPWDDDGDDRGDGDQSPSTRDGGGGGECVILAGRDMTKSGTWLGVEMKTGRFAAVTNYRLPSARPDRGGAAATVEAEDGEERDHGVDEDDSSTSGTRTRSNSRTRRKRLKRSSGLGGSGRSRGELPVRFLRCDTSKSPLEYLEREVVPLGGEYDGFNFVVYDPKFDPTTKMEEEAETTEGCGGEGGVLMADATAAHYCNVVRNRVFAVGGAEAVVEAHVVGNAHDDNDVNDDDVNDAEALRAKPRARELKRPGIHVISNGPIGTKWPKMRRLEEAMSDILSASSSSSSSKERDDWARGPSSSTTASSPTIPPPPQSARPLHERLFDVLSDTTRAPDDELPNTGLDLRWERDLSSIFVRCDPLCYGTLCSTVVLMDGYGAVNFWERTFVSDEVGDEDEDRDEDGLSKVKRTGVGESGDVDVKPTQVTGGKVSSQGGRTRTVHYSFVVGSGGRGRRGGQS